MPNPVTKDKKITLRPEIRRRDDGVVILFNIELRDLTVVFEPVLAQKIDTVCGAAGIRALVSRLSGAQAVTFLYLQNPLFGTIIVTIIQCD